jgi:outer membrane lipoprotein-sorting protein
MRSAALLLALLVAAQAGVAAETPTEGWGLPQLMARLASVRAATGSFVERRYQQMLTEPQQSSGRLVYVAPDKLQKDVLQPSTERMMVDGGMLVVEREGDRPRRLALEDYPAIGAIIESVRGTLAGDLPALERHYRVSLEGSAAGWTIVLDPADAKLREFVTAVRISGREGKVERIVTEEAGGDRTETSIVAETR